MNLKKVLHKEVIVAHLTADTKPAVIEELIDILDATGKVKNREKALQAVLNREEKMSTGMQHGIAIPHGKTDAVDELLVTVALKPEGIDFDAMDGQPCSIFIMTLSSIKRTGPHIQFLAEISKILSCEGMRQKLLDADSADEVLELLTT